MEEGDGNGGKRVVVIGGERVGKGEGETLNSVTANNMGMTIQSPL